MDELLRPVQTSKSKPSSSLIAEIPSRPKSHKFSTASEIIDTLKDQPDPEVLHGITQSLNTGNSETGDIRVPSATSTQILRLLVDEIVPTYWTNLEDDDSQKSLRHLLIQCLRSFPGVEILVSRIKSLLATPKAGLRIAVLLSVLQATLAGSDFIRRVFDDIDGSTSNDTQKSLYMKETSKLLCNGQILSTAARAEAILREDKEIRKPLWVADGNKYSKWLAQNMSFAVASVVLDASGEWVHLAFLFGRSFSLGYQGQSENLDCVFPLSNFKQKPLPQSSWQA
jgi:telomere length regulation protein